MSQNQDISKYFNKDPAGKQTEFFDQITSVSSNNSQDNVDTTVQKEAEEPVVCKIFQAAGPVKSETDPSSFFDMIGSVKTDLGGDNTLAKDKLSSNPSAVTTNDILDSFKSYNENLTKTSRVSELERSRDAWIPPDSTRRALISMITSPPGTFVPDINLLTMPGVILEEEMKDTVYEAVHHYLGPAKAAERKVLSVTEVTQDDRGIKDLIQAGCYRAAVNLTKRLLTIYGQGAGRAGHPSKHTVHSIQLWFTRLALLVKLKSFSLADVESEPFGDLDKPDMFFQFYPELYGGRLGSMVPFSLRLLVAQIPAYMEKHQKALTRLHSLLATIRKMLSNLEKGLLEDRSPCELNPADRQESVKLWTFRETQVLHAIVNCALSFKDYALAIEVMQVLVSREQNPTQLRSLQSALGRILLQLGDIVSGEHQFSLSQKGLPTLGGRDLVDSGLVLVAQNNFQEASVYFEKAISLNPKNITALNNMSVCLLYMGQLKKAVILLEETLQKYPSLALHESLLLNLCTLYELQSSFSSQAKLKLLALVSQFKGDGINLACLKLQM